MLKEDLCAKHFALSTHEWKDLIEILKQAQKDYELRASAVGHGSELSDWNYLRIECWIELIEQTPEGEEGTS